MDLGELSVACLFGSRPAPAFYEVGLGFQGRELTVGGYQRATIRSADWQVDGATARAEATFEPFDQSAPVDALLIFLPDGSVLPPTRLGDGSGWLPATATIPVVIGFETDEDEDDDG